MKTRKSQITIVLVLGIVLLFVFSFLFYTTIQISKLKGEKNVKKITQDIFDTTAIKTYVQTCLEETSKEALILSSLQGGNIYETQIKGGAYFKGPTDSPTLSCSVIGNEGCNLGVNLIPYIYNDENYYLTYAIIKPNFAEPPYYPYNSLDDSLTDKPSIVNAIGNYHEPNENYVISRLPPLCYRTSSNYWDLPTVKYSCEIYESTHPTRTVQAYLEKYITENIRGCVDFNNKVKKFEGYNISEGPIKAEVMFGEDNVVVTLNYSIIAAQKKGAPITTMRLFYSEQKIRYKQIYELAYHIIKEDVKNIFFNATRLSDLQGLGDCKAYDTSVTGIFKRTEATALCLKDGIFVESWKDYCSNSNYHSELDCTVGEYSDIIVIKDIESEWIAKNTPFIFLFSVENRIPALDYIDESVSSSFFYYNYLNTYYGKTPTDFYKKTDGGEQSENYNIVVDDSDTNNLIEIIPLGIDPDEDDVAYEYSGWKTDTEIKDTNDNYYQYPITPQDCASKVSCPTGCEFYGGSCQNNNEWHKSDYYLNGYNNNEKNKDANYLTNPADVGYHLVRVDVTDNDISNSVWDYQDILIQVRCLDNGQGEGEDSEDKDCCLKEYDYHYAKGGEACGEIRDKWCDGNLQNIQDTCKVKYKRQSKCGTNGECTGTSDEVFTVNSPSEYETFKDVCPGNECWYCEGSKAHIGTCKSEDKCDASQTSVCSLGKCGATCDNQNGCGSSSTYCSSSTKTFHTLSPYCTADCACDSNDDDTGNPCCLSVYDCYNTCKSPTPKKVCSSNQCGCTA